MNTKTDKLEAPVAQYPYRVGMIAFTTARQAIEWGCRVHEPAYHRPTDRVAMLCPGCGCVLHAPCPPGTAWTQPEFWCRGCGGCAWTVYS